MTFFLLLAIQDAKIQLGLTPGSTHKYEVTRDYKAVSEPERTVFVDQVVFEVAKDKNDGRAKLTASYTPIKTILEGFVTMASDPDPLVLHEERATDGRVLSRDPFPYVGIVRERQTRVTDVLFPPDKVKSGSVWTRDEPQVTGNGLPPARWRWTCTAVDDTTAKLKLEFSERESTDSVTADGTITISLATGWPDAIDVFIRKTVVPGDSENVVNDLHVTWRKL